MVAQQQRIGVTDGFHRHLSQVHMLLRGNEGLAQRYAAPSSCAISSEMGGMPPSMAQQAMP